MHCVLRHLGWLVQVVVPVMLPDQAPMAVGIVGLQRSDLRLLAAVQQLGPLIQEAASKLWASRKSDSAAPADSNSASSSPAKSLMNGSAKKKSPGATHCTVAYYPPVYHAACLSDQL